MISLPDIPTAISPREASFMEALARNKIVVEFGALLGFSTVVLAKAASWLVSVDRHKDYSGPTYKAFMSNLERYRVTNVDVYVGDCLDYASKRGWWRTMDPDICFIDLTGKYALTKMMLESIPTDLAMVHDLDRPNCQVGEAIRDAGWEIVGQVDTLALARRT